MNKSTAVTTAVLALTANGASSGATSTGTGGAGPALLELLTSVSHFWGIFVSLLVIYYAHGVIRELNGEGVIAESGKYTLAGSLAFLLAFLNMELEHGLGVSATHSWLSYSMDQAVHMTLFVLMMLMLGEAFRKLAETFR